jgi:hypothetical protein
MTLLRRLWRRFCAISEPARHANHRPKAWHGTPTNRWFG